MRPVVTDVQYRSTSNGLSNMNLRSIIAAKFQEVAERQQRELAPLSDDLVLMESGTGPSFVSR